MCSRNDTNTGSEDEDEDEGDDADARSGETTLAAAVTVLLGRI